MFLSPKGIAGASRASALVATMNLTPGCSAGRGETPGPSTEGLAGATTAQDTDSGATTAQDTDSPTHNLDVANDSTGSLPVDECLARDLDILAGNGSMLPCADRAPPESFDPVEEWHYPPGDLALQSLVTPLVINWNDDNGDGRIDMCDRPDVVLTAFYESLGECTIHIIDGDYANTGIVHRIIDDLDLNCNGHPAVGDIDNDGEPEIVAVSNSLADTLIAIDNDGSLLWESDANPSGNGLTAWKSGAVALHDLDNNGTYEILYNHTLFDNSGSLLWTQVDPDYATVVGTYGQTTTAADLDDDGDLELITAFSAHDFDNVWTPTTLWDFEAAGILSGFSTPHVANFDDDPDPEVLYTSDLGYLLAEHDGTIKWGPIKPALSVPCERDYWGGFMRPAAVHDYDGDGNAEFAVAACNTFAICDVTEGCGPASDQAATECTTVAS